MLKERYAQAFRALHAEDDLIDRTMDAAAKRARPQPKIRWQPAAVFVCALVALAVVFTQLPPPRDTLAATNMEEVEENLLPLPDPTPSDDLTITVSNVGLTDYKNLYFDLTISGDKVNSLSDFSLHTSFNQKGMRANVFDSDPSALADPRGSVASCTKTIRPGNERHFTVRVTAPITTYWCKYGPELQLSITQYTSGRDDKLVFYDVDWSTVDDTRPYNSAPLIDMDYGYAITAFSFEIDGRLCIHIRRPEGTPENLVGHAWLTKPDEAYSHRGVMSRRERGSENGYVYTDLIMDITRDELTGYQLVTESENLGEVIRGNWTYTVDLSKYQR